VTQSALALWTADGEMYAYPFSTSPFAMFVNNDVITAAGQKTPAELIAAGEWTWDNANVINVELARQRDDLLLGQVRTIGAQGDRAPEPGPVGVDPLGHDGVQPLGFAWVLGPQADLHHSLSEERPRAFRNPLPEIEDLDIGVLSGTRHRQNHFVPPLCTKSALRSH
jgi:hypothetical protein